MDPKVICVLSVILVVALSTLAEGKPAPTRCQCKVAAMERNNCGYPGISAAECKKIGCCFNNSIPDMPWCFTPKPKKERARAALPVLRGLDVQFKKSCPTDVRGRRNCGFPGITAKQCERRGCCFNSHPAGVPWCFYHRVVEEAC